MFLVSARFARGQAFPAWLFGEWEVCVSDQWGTLLAAKQTREEVEGHPESPGGTIFGCGMRLCEGVAAKSHGLLWGVVFFSIASEEECHVIT